MLRWLSSSIVADKLAGPYSIVLYQTDSIIDPNSRLVIGAALARNSKSTAPLRCRKCITSSVNLPDASASLHIKLIEWTIASHQSGERFLGLQEDTLISKPESRRYKKGGVGQSSKLARLLGVSALVFVAFSADTIATGW